MPNDDNKTAVVYGIDADFGPHCLYKNGEDYICNSEAEYEDRKKAGWKNTPQPLKEAVAKVAAKPAAKKNGKKNGKKNTANK